jgi:hypothetical protein
MPPVFAGLPAQLDSVAKGIQIGTQGANPGKQTLTEPSRQIC